MHYHQYLDPDAKWLIARAEAVLGETAAEILQAGANTMCTEMELGNDPDDARERIQRLYNDNAYHQALADLGARIQYSGNRVSVLSRWLDGHTGKAIDETDLDRAAEYALEILSAVYHP